MDDPKPPNPRAPVPTATPCAVRIGMSLHTPAGHGHVLLERGVLWPGVPQEGQWLCIPETPLCQGVEIATTGLDFGESHDSLCVYLQHLDLAEVESHGWPANPDLDERECFLEAVQAMFDSGWHLKEPATWHPHSETPPGAEYGESFFEDTEEEVS